MVFPVFRENHWRYQIFVNGKIVGKKIIYNFCLKHFFLKLIVFEILAKNPFFIYIYIYIYIALILSTRQLPWLRFSTVLNYMPQPFYFSYFCPLCTKFGEKCRLSRLWNATDSRHNLPISHFKTIAKSIYRFYQDYSG